MKDIFISAIHTKNKLKIRFFSQKDNTTVERTCAPLDYGPSGRTKDQGDRFHFWDFEGAKEPHIVSQLPENVLKIFLLEDRFDPKLIVKWIPNWVVSRNW